jgi:hypothetical protein
MNQPDKALAMMSPIDGPAPEIDVSVDIIKRGLMVAPVLVAICTFIWSGPGAVGAGYGVALVLVNFLMAAGLIALAARFGLGMVLGVSLFGYLLRLALIFLAVFVVKDAGWISLPALGATIIVTHLGLLVWEMKYVALTLAHPGLKPARS